MKTWKVGIAGLIDDRIWPQLEQWFAYPGMEVTAAADPNGPLVSRARDTLGVSHFYPGWREMLAREDLHYLHVGLEPAERADLVEEAAARGIHCLLEGPMSASLEGAERMLAARRRHQTQILVNWPAGRNPAYLQLLRMVQEEAAGPVLQVRQRIERPPSKMASPYFSRWLHGPRQAGGGALMGDCAYGANLCRTLVGLPNTCTAVTAHLARDSGEYDDSAILVISYTTAMGIVEANWLDFPSAGGPEVTVQTASGSLLLTGESLVWASGDQTRVIPIHPLPEHLLYAPWQLIHSVIHETEVEDFCNAQVSRDTQEILEAALLSVENQRTVRLPLR